MLLLGEVAEKMAPVRVVLGQHVEEKRFDIVVERLVIEKQFSQQAEVLTVDSIDVSVDFEHGQIVLVVDFVGRRVKGLTRFLHPWTTSVTRAKERMGWNLPGAVRRLVRISCISDRIRR